MKFLLVIIAGLLFVTCSGQTINKFNLGFEKQKYKTELSDGWGKWGKYDLVIDTLAHTGKRSGKITSDEAGSSFGSIAYRIPANYKGSTIKLEGYMKIKNVANGFAGFLLRIDATEVL